MPKKDDFDNIKMSDRDIYSHSPEDIRSHSFVDISSGRRPDEKYIKQVEKRKKRKKHRLLKAALAVICCVAVLFMGFYAYAYSIIDKIEREPLDQNDLGISTSNYTGIKNIALLGIDSHEDNDTGRSDAIVIVSVDKKNRKLKMTSIARDSYVEIEGHGKDKLTHSYAFGKSQLAVKTLNRNYGLEITDYVSMNFFEFARIIDYIGGVTVDVDEAEMKELNQVIIPPVVLMGIDCELIKAPGVQQLSGGQALCYSRIRHTDSDIGRGSRQREVLSAMFAEVKKMNPLELPRLAEMIVGECKTSLSTNAIISLGAWAVLASPEIEQLSIPNDNFSSAGRTIGGVWYYTYDIKAAGNDIADFIFERNFYSPEQKKAREGEK